MNKIIGIDPGYDRLGWAILKKEKNKPEIIDSGCFTTDKKEDFNQRLKSVGLFFESLIKKHQPDLVVLESIIFNQSRNTAIGVIEVKGIIKFLACQNNISTEEYTPLEAKKIITGYGRAEKNQVIKTIQQITDIKKPVKYDDEFDAIMIALTGLALAKYN
ncbi:MAG: crossover junction endodeoxyribonuclease RuvC [Patescibacteria group bacterium]